MLAPAAPDLPGSQAADGGWPTHSLRIVAGYRIIPYTYQQEKDNV